MKRIKNKDRFKQRGNNIPPNIIHKDNKHLNRTQRKHQEKKDIQNENI